MGNLKILSVTRAHADAGFLRQGRGISNFRVGCANLDLLSGNNFDYVLQLMKRCAQYYYEAVDANSDTTSIGPPVSTL